MHGKYPSHPCLNALSDVLSFRGFLILFVLAMFFMLRNRAEGQLILLFTAVLMAGFAIVQVALDVSLATLASSFFHITTKEGMSPHALSLMNMFSMGYKARQGILATNKYVPSIRAH